MENSFLVIVGTIVGFFGLAAALLIPIYLFLKREEKTAELWTAEQLAIEPDGATDPDETKSPGRNELTESSL